MARKLFERQGIRVRGGALATGQTFVVYTDEAGTALADISATSGGSAIAGSTITVAAIDGLGPASFRFWGPTDDTAVLYLRDPDDASLGVQEIEAEPEAGGATDHGALTGLADDDHPQYATDTDLTTHAGAANPHSVYALDTDLSTHEGDTTSIHGIADTSALATSAGVTTAVSTHTALGEAHHPDHRINGGKETVQAHGAMGSTETFDLANGNIHTGTLDASCTFTFTAPTNSVGCSMVLILTQNGTGGFTVTWPASVKWPGATTPTLTTTLNKTTILSFFTINAGTTWYGTLAGDNFS